MPLHSRPRFDKIIELLLLLAHEMPGADKYQAVKFLYLADREHLLRYGRPITREHYYALWYGPVASHAMDLLEGDKITFRQAGIDHLPFRTEVAKDHRGKDITYIREPLRAINEDVLSDSDVEIFRNVVQANRDKNFESLMNMTHDHVAYKKAWNSRGLRNRAPMQYEDMIEDEQRRSDLLEDDYMPEVPKPAFRS